MKIRKYLRGGTLKLYNCMRACLAASALANFLQLAFPVNSCPSIVTDMVNIFMWSSPVISFSSYPIPMNNKKTNQSKYTNVNSRDFLCSQGSKFNPKSQWKLEDFLPTLKKNPNLPKKKKNKKNFFWKIGIFIQSPHTSYMVTFSFNFMAKSMCDS